MQQISLDKKTYLNFLLYFLVTILLKWRLSFTPLIIYYFLGGLVGIHLLTIFGRFFKNDTASLKNILAQVLIFILTIFALTSSTNYFGKGLVLALNLKYLLLQKEDLKIQKNLDSWVSLWNVKINGELWKSYLYLVIGLFIFFSLLFVLI